MRKMKQILAVALATTLVIGTCVTALADDNSGSSTGEGSSEGHVERKLTNVVLPTMPESGSPFAYTMDPERLIAETSHEKYGNAVEFPASDDTGVYFNNGKKGGQGDDKDNIVYANHSAAQKVTNKSSHAIELTVSVTATGAETDVPLVAAEAIEDAEVASLYLGLVVGSNAAETISKEAAASKSVTIAGNEDNFKVAVVSGNYVYRVLTLDEYKEKVNDNTKTQDDYDATWATSEFQIEGAVTEDLAITSTTTAPTIEVTWSWEDPTVEPEAPTEAAPSIATTSYTVDGTEDVDITVNLGLGDAAATGIASITFKNSSGADRTMPSSDFSLSGTTLTISKNQISNWVDAGVTSRVFTITFNDEENTAINVTFAVE